jgi:hypothetical protein
LFDDASLSSSFQSALDLDLDSIEDVLAAAANAALSDESAWSSPVSQSTSPSTSVGSFDMWAAPASGASIWAPLSVSATPVVVSKPSVVAAPAPAADFDQLVAALSVPLRADVPAFVPTVAPAPVVTKAAPRKPIATSYSACKPLPTVKIATQATTVEAEQRPKKVSTITSAVCTALPTVKVANLSLKPTPLPRKEGQPTKRTWNDACVVRAAAVAAAMIESQA